MGEPVVAEEDEAKKKRNATPCKKGKDFKKPIVQSQLATRSKTIKKAAPLHYLTRLHQKNPEAIKELCHAREMAKKRRKEEVWKRISVYAKCCTDPLWMDPDSDECELIDHSF